MKSLAIGFKAIHDSLFFLILCSNNLLPFFLRYQRLVQTNCRALLRQSGSFYDLLLLLANINCSIFQIMYYNNKQKPIENHYAQIINLNPKLWFYYKKSLLFAHFLFLLSFSFLHLFVLSIQEKAINFLGLLLALKMSQAAV